MVETLETLSKFVKQYPQIRNGDVEYSFLGGTAIRLAQESIERGERVISDFDIVNFGSLSYPVHTIDPKIIFGLVNADTAELKSYVEQSMVGSQNYYFMNGAFLTLTKTCAVDNPREKDFEDVSFLYQNGRVNLKELKKLFGKTRSLTNNSDLSLEILDWLLLSDLDLGQRKKIFQAFPRFVNLLDEFKYPLEIRETISDCVESMHFRDGYQNSSVVYNIHNVLRELNLKRDFEKLKAVLMLFDKSRMMGYIDFDRQVSREIIPKIRYSKKQGIGKLEESLK